jgi:hypothetical protein
MSKHDRAAGEFPEASEETHRKSRRVVISSTISEASLEVEAAAGKIRLYVTTAIRIETDGGGRLPDELGDEAASSLAKRLSRPTKR